jgi:hypothetical protein
MLNGSSDNYKDTQNFARLKLQACP